MIRRALTHLGPFRLHPWVLGGSLAAVYGIAVAGYYIDRSFFSATVLVNGLLPALVVGVVVGLIASRGAAWQRSHGVSWPSYLITICAMGLVMPALRLLLDLVPDIPGQTPGLVLAVLRSILVVLTVAAVVGNLTARLERQVAATEQALAFAREQQVQLLSADEDARRQAALLLHDRVQAGLISACLELRALARDLSADQRALLEPTLRRLEELRAVDVRNAVRALSPNLDDVDLQTALEDLAMQFETTLDIEVQVDVDVDRARAALGPRMLLAAYRIVEQALLNTAVHAAASSVRVTVRRTESGLLVEVTDDGLGIRSEERGLGTTIITTWTRAMNGSWRWTGGPQGIGTTLTAELGGA